MVRVVGETPRFAHESERLVWERLSGGARTGTVLMPNMRLTSAVKDHELDVVVLMPGVGVVVVEVKGGSVSVDAQGRWWSGGGRVAAASARSTSAATASTPCATFVEGDPRWKNSAQPGAVGTRGRRAVHRRRRRLRDTRLSSLDDQRPRRPRRPRGSGARRRCALQENGQRVPNADDVELILEILTGRSFPCYDIAAEADEREAAADRLTQEQAHAAPGDAAHQPHGDPRGSRQRQDDPGPDPGQGPHPRAGRPQGAARGPRLLLDRALREYFKRQLAGVPRHHRPAFVGHLRGPRQRVGQSTGFARPQRRRLLGARLPHGWPSIAAGLPDGKKFDAVIVDEAQDFADHWWHPLMKALRDEDEGGLYVYSDENQRIFARFGQPPVPLVPLVLDHNLRNTQQIAGPSGRSRRCGCTCAAATGADVRFVPCAREEAIDVADDQVDLLLEAGWRPEHVALLTMGSRHPAQVERQDGRRPCRLLAVLLGQRRRLLRPRPRLQGARTRAPSCSASTRRPPTAPRRCSTSACPGPPTSSSSSATRASSARSAGPGGAPARHRLILVVEGRAAWGQLRRAGGSRDDHGGHDLRRPATSGQ